MPAFKNVVSRHNMAYIKRKLGINTAYDGNIGSIFDATLYFILEEIYYHSFVQEQNDCSLFEKGIDALKKEYKKEKNNKKQNALKWFEEYFNKIKKPDNTEETIPLEKLCEIIMTEYNMQNNIKEKIASRDTKKKADQLSYKHFPILLHQCMREAFIKYVINCDKFQILKKPIKPAKVSSSVTAISDHKTAITSLSEKVSNERKYELQLFTTEVLEVDVRILAWYVTVHFLSPKYLNQLNGAVLSYIQTIEDIAERAKKNGIITKPFKEQKDYYTKVVRVIGLVRNYAGRITQEFQDYFEGDEEKAAEEYANYLSEYVDFSQEIEAIKRESSDVINPKTLALRAFENKIMGYRPTGSSGGIYYDGINPIINKKIIHTMLYGNVKSVEGSIQCAIKNEKDKIEIAHSKVTENDLQTYYNLYGNADIVNIRNGKFDKEELQKRAKELYEKYKKYQNQKNRVELLDVRILGEIVNDLTAKMISWSYLRERDLLYFQLGVQYMRLNYASEENQIDEKDFRRKIYIENEVNIKEGGILYQLMAMNTYGMPLFVKDKKGNVAKKESKIPYDWTNYFNAYSNEEYVQCLEIFEETSKHKDIINSREYFAHFKYFGKADRSIMEMYSDVYKTFFSYDTKLKKSIFYIMADILKGYFVIIGTRAFTGDGQGVQKESDKQERYQIGLKDKIESDVLTYKVNEKPVQVYARSTMFLEQVRNVLLYKEGKEAKDE